MLNIYQQHSWIELNITEIHFPRYNSILLRDICGRSRYYWDKIAKITKYCCNTFADITKICGDTFADRIKFYWNTFATRIIYYWYMFVEGVVITEIQLRK